MNETKRKEYILVGIIISVLVHLLMIFIIGSTKYYHAALPQSPALADKKASEEQEKKQLILPPKPIQEKKTAYLTPGSAVWFKNNAPAVAQKAPDNSTNNIPKALTNVAVAQPVAAPLPKPQKAPQKPLEQEKKSLEQPKVSEKPKQAERAKVPANKIPDTEKKPAAEHSKGLQEEKKILEPANTSDAPEPVKSPQEKSLPATSDSAAVTLQQEPTPPTTAEQKKTNRGLALKGLQRGFTEFLRQGNNDIMHREGDPNKNPTPKDLKLMSYYRQIDSALESAILYVGKMNTQHLEPDAGVCYTLVIERDGSISSLQLTQKSKHAELNEHALKVLKNLGSLPPLPHYIQAPHFYRAGFLYFYDSFRARR
jgi:hypothetical protein